MATLADVFEALNMAQRLKRSRQMKKIAPRIKIARARAMKKTASKEVLMKRAKKKARAMILDKILKGIPKDELSMARKQEVEKRLEKPAMKSKIERLALKILPKMRKLETDRKSSGGGTDD